MSLVRVSYRVCLQSNSLAMLERNFMDWKKFRLQIQLTKLEVFASRYTIYCIHARIHPPLTVILKLHWADNPSSVEATYVIG